MFKSHIRLARSWLEPDLKSRADWPSGVRSSLNYRKIDEAAEGHKGQPATFEQLALLYTNWSFNQLANPSKIVYYGTPIRLKVATAAPKQQGKGPNQNVRIALTPEWHIQHDIRGLLD